MAAYGYFDFDSKNMKPWHQEPRHQAMLAAQAAF
jgi:hypothetical protein